jgi:hypothetical protein
MGRLDSLYLDENVREKKYNFNYKKKLWQQLQFESIPTTRMEIQ